MDGMKAILFGIAVILASGFTFVHDAILYGVTEYGPGPETGLVKIGMLVGLAISFYGLMYGDSAADSEVASRNRNL